ncbi:NINE protein [Enterobacter asburiae]|uniref:TM2 domain-containing protein n=1 Tax=Enterobacter asburiae TaxID=61645 RepID=UPI003F56AA2A
MANMVFCRGCGKEIHSSAPLCPHCGARQLIYMGRSRTVAIIITCFFGGIGGHKFYLGKPGMGILYLLFFWTCIPMIIAFIEVIMYLCMSDESFNAKYNR